MAMTNTSWLSTFLHWMFAVFSVLAILVTVVLFAVWLVDPQLPPDARFGPHHMNLMNEPGTVALQNSTFTVTALRGNIVLTVRQAGGLIEVLKHHGFPVAMLNTAFFALLFDFLRRLFRNVGRGESFTWQSVRLVQIVGLSLIVFSYVSAFAQRWFMHAAYAYLSQHAALSISGTPLHLPPVHGEMIPLFPPLFFSGLLVLALSEVFRQGLVLKSENDLTV